MKRIGNQITILVVIYRDVNYQKYTGQDDAGLTPFWFV